MKTNKDTLDTGNKDMSKNKNEIPLLDWYEEALRKERIHSWSSMELKNVKVKELFEDDNAKNFINNYLEDLYLENSDSKFKELLNKITEFRARHTVASFLLGILMKEELTLDMRDWIKIASNSDKPTFGFIWSLTCLTHDVAYEWENNSEKMIEQVRTIEDFCAYNNIKYNLLEEAKEAELIKNYYKYRVKKFKKIDHGITGAILIYDALMTFYEEIQHKENGANLFAKKNIRLSKNFPNFCRQISEAIALHNMWRAKEKDKKEYEKEKLYTLIPDGSDGEKIFCKRDSMLLFLLAVIDTMDPIKVLCNNEKGEDDQCYIDKVLNEFSIDFVNIGTKEDKRKQICVKFNDPRFGKYKEKIKDMETWLGVSVESSDECILKISIRMNPNEQLQSDRELKSA